jgi:hypothetical protein
VAGVESATLLKKCTNIRISVHCAGVLPIRVDVKLTLGKRAQLINVEGGRPSQPRLAHHAPIAQCECPTARRFPSRQLQRPRTGQPPWQLRERPQVSGLCFVSQTPQPRLRLAHIWPRCSFLQELHITFRKNYDGVTLKFSAAPHRAMEIVWPYTG